MKCLNRCLALRSGLLLLGLAWPAAAHNGAVAIAVPVEGIKVDGDLSDWPAGLQTYPIALPESGVAPRGLADFLGQFRLGFDPKHHALLLAVEVEDESAVITTSAPQDRDTQDGCEVYVKLRHQDDKSPPVQYSIRGNSRIHSGDTEGAVKRTGNRHAYEWRILVSATAPAVLGIDVVICDKDRDGSFSWMAWGRGSTKIESSAHVGDAVLVESNDDVGMVAGRVFTELDTGEKAIT